MLLDSKAKVPYFTRMTTLTVTSKGQVTLRKDLLLHLGVGPGERIALAKLPDGRIEVRADRRLGQISKTFKMLKRQVGTKLLTDEINEVAARGWAGKR